MLLIFLGYARQDDALEFLRYCFIILLVLHDILTRGCVLSSHIAVARRREVHTSTTVIIRPIPAAAAFKGGTAYPTINDIQENLGAIVNGLGYRLRSVNAVNEVSKGARDA